MWSCMSPGLRLPEKRLSIKTSLQRMRVGSVSQAALPEYSSGLYGHSGRSGSSRGACGNLRRGKSRSLASGDKAYSIERSTSCASRSEKVARKAKNLGLGPVEDLEAGKATRQRPRPALRWRLLVSICVRRSASHSSSDNWAPCVITKAAHWKESKQRCCTKEALAPKVVRHAGQTDVSGMKRLIEAASDQC